MGNLGDAVSALLDTYTKCLSLLKRLDRPSQQQLPDNDNTSVSIRTVKDASSPFGLAAALRKARTRVSRSYSSGVARRGSAFAKGDATSKKSLNRVLARLTATMAGLGAWFTRSSSSSSGGGGGEGTGLQAADGALSYASLVSLCNSSHTDAVRAMTDLSSRIGSRAGSRASGSSSSVVTATNASVAASTRSSKSSRSRRDGTGKKHRSSGGGAAQPRRGKKGHRDDKHASAAADRGSRPKTKTKTRESGDKSRERDRSGSSSSRSKRASRLTMSSASTKLGEVRRHGRRDQQSGVAYPRHSLEFGSDGSLYGGGQKVKKRWWQF